MAAEHSFGVDNMCTL